MTGAHDAGRPRGADSGEIDLKPSPAVETPVAGSSVPAAVQLRRAAWMTAFPATIGLVTLLFHSWRLPAARALATGAAILLSGSTAFFVALATASLLFSTWRGSGLALRTRGTCPACARSLWIIQTRCSHCDAAVPVSREALPTFAYTACAYALFQILVLLALHRWDRG